MKKFIVKSILWILLSAICIVFADICMLLIKDRWSSLSHERNVILAYDRLKTLHNKKKIVIVSGSNGQFSINSRMIHKAFNIPVINTSTSAGIGVRMQFEIYKDFLHEGDIVILCPEYGSEESRLYGGTGTLRVLSTFVPSAYEKVSIRQWLFLHKYIGTYFWRAFTTRNDKELEGPYSANVINEYGDIECERIHRNLVKIENTGVKWDKNLLEYLKYIHCYTKDNGIKLMFLPPTYMESAYKKYKMQIDSLDYSLRQYGIGWQAPPSRYSFPDSLYFDTSYHMTELGANKRTEVLIEDLRRILHYER